jgi:uncharacterized membrane protein
MNQRMPVPMQRGQDFFVWGGGPHRGGGGDSLEWVIFALLLLLIVLVIALLVLSVMRRPGFGGPRHGKFKLHGPPGGGRPWGRPDALEIARARYAQGAIGRDEYLQLVDDLGGRPEPPPPPPA